jgi:hypothetical protein
MRIRALALICSFSVILSTMLAGCGGGGGGEGEASGAPPGGPPEDTSDATTRQALQTTNLDVPPGGGPTFGTLKRWSLPIPVKNSEPRATQAMDRIEGRFGSAIFDRASIAGLDDASITRGLIISVGTADPGSTQCGSANPGDGDPAEISDRIFIHIDRPGCAATVDETIHQFGHALGMYGHFQNFGDGNSIGELFWRVLRTIYLPANSIGTPGANVVLAP